MTKIFTEVRGNIHNDYGWLLDFKGKILSVNLTREIQNPRSWKLEMIPIMQLAADGRQMVGQKHTDLRVLTLLWGLFS